MAEKRSTVTPAPDEECVDNIGDFAVVPVPKNEQRRFLSNVWVSSGWIICVSTLFTGAAVATGLTVTQMIGASIGGMAVIALYVLLLGSISGKYHVCASVTLRQAFGRYGSALMGTIVALVLGVGWFAWQASFFGLSINTIAGSYWFGDVQVATIWGGLLMMATAVIGYKGLGVLSFLAVPLVMLLTVFGLHASIGEAGSFGAILEMIGPGEPIGIGVAISSIAGSVMAGAIAIGDITRYSKNGLQGGLSAAVGYGLGGTIALMIGGMIAVVTQVAMVGTTPHVPDAMLALGLGTGAIAILILAQWTTNDNNLYSGALGLANYIPFNKRIITTLLGLFGTGIAAVGIFEHFIGWLGSLGIWLPPIGGVLMCDYWLIHKLILKKEYEIGAGKPISLLNVAALIAFIAGGVVAYKLTWGVAALNGLFTAFIVYAILAIICEKGNIKYKIGEHIVGKEGY